MTVETPARDVPCPACQARAGEQCTQPSDTTRKPVTWHHLARIAAANEVPA